MKNEDVFIEGGPMETVELEDLSDAEKELFTKKATEIYQSISVDLLAHDQHIKLPDLSSFIFGFITGFSVFKTFLRTSSKKYDN